MGLAAFNRMRRLKAEEDAKKKPAKSKKAPAKKKGEG